MERIFYFAQINIICIILLAIMFVTIYIRDIVQSKQIIFRAIIITTASMCFFDIMAWAFSGQVFPGSDILIHVSNMAYFMSITVVGYLWLLYVNSIIRDLNTNYRKDMMLYAIPLAAMMIIIIINPFTKWLFTIDENNVYHRGDFVWIHWVFSYSYILIATVQAFVAAHKTEKISKKAEIKPLKIFIFWPLAASLIQMFFYGITTTQCGITLGIITISLQSLRSEVTTDELTTLNNRVAFDRFISEHLHFNGGYFSVMMLDIDKFKTINDTMGHTVGDYALKIFAAVLRSACDAVQQNAFLCRYGGDEFVLCVPSAETNFEKLIEYVNENLALEENKVGGKINLGMSHGIACAHCNTADDVSELLKQADDLMYDLKKVKHLTAE